MEFAEASHSLRPDGEAAESDPMTETVSVRRFYRHDIAVRVFHWTNALCFFLPLMSRFQIFNAHPALYWGKVYTFDTPAFAIVSDGNLIARGETKIAVRSFDTNGWLGATGENGTSAFPQWATVPADQDLATGPRWHFLMAWLLVLNGIAYLVYGFVRGRLWRAHDAEVDISPWFKPNGTEEPPDRAYRALAQRKFADYALVVEGLVDRPQKLSLADLRKLPARTQITRTIASRAGVASANGLVRRSPQSWGKPA